MLPLVASLTISQLLQQGTALVKHSESARLDVELLLAFVLKKDRSYFFTWPEKNIETEQFQQFVQLLERRIVGEPIAYILGKKDFWSLTLSVNESTLIPRSDTEVLVEQALTLCTENTGVSVLDLGTGTGAVALALAAERPQWRIVGVDKQIEACELAERNRQEYQLDNVTIIRSDWFSEIAPQKFTMIVSNPLSIDKNDEHLVQGDVRFEPHSALTADNHGLADIEAIVQQAPDYLTSQGLLMFEHGYQQAEAVKALLQKQGFSHCFTANDIAGNPRVTGGRLL